MKGTRAGAGHTGPRKDSDYAAHYTSAEQLVFLFLQVRHLGQFGRST